MITPWRDHRLAVARGQHGVVGEREVRHGGVAVALLGHGAEAEAAAGAGAEVADRLAVEADRGGVADRGLAGEREQQLVLAVAGDAGDAEDLAGAHGEGDVLERDVEVAGAGEAQAASTDEALGAEGAALGLAGCP